MNETNKASEALVAAEEAVQKMCDEAFAKGYNQGVMDTAAPDEEPEAEAECEVMFDIKSDVELDDEACNKIRYKAALMSAVKFGLDLGASPEGMIEDLEMTYDDMVGK